MADDLLIAACDPAASGGHGSASLQQHLAVCADCRARLHDQRALMSELRSVLAPDTHDHRTAARILAGLGERRREPGRRRAPAAWLLAGAAAAGLMAALSARPLLQPEPAAGPDSLAAGRPAAAALQLSDLETDEIRAALALVAWDAPLDSGLSAVPLVPNSNDASQARSAVLPWTAEDDWDRPAQARNRKPDAERTG